MKKRYLLILVFFLWACQTETPIKRTYFFKPIKDKENQWVLPLDTEIRLISENPKDNEILYDIVQERLSSLHSLVDSSHFYLNNHQETIENIAAINASYGTGKKVFVQEELINFLQESLNLARLTEGYFNPTIGSLSELWKPLFRTKDSTSVDPDSNAIQDALACVVKAQDLSEIIEINEIENSVLFHQYPTCEKRVILDLGAFAKGYVSDKIFEALLPYQSSYLWDAGASSLRASSGSQKKVWKIGINHPDDNSLFLTVECADCSISSSFDNQRYFFTPHHIRRHHILNPYTGYPENHYRGITLLSSGNASVLDTLSTALFCIEDHTTQQRIIQNIERHYHITIQKIFIQDNRGQIQLWIDENLKDKIDIFSEEYSIDFIPH